MTGLISLGDVVKHKYTPFKGTVVSLNNPLHGLTQYGVQPRQLKNGIPQEIVWFESGSIELQEEYEARMAEKSSKKQLDTDNEKE